MSDPVPFAYFKDWRIGDYAMTYRPNVRLVGTSPSVKTPTSAASATISDKGGAMSWEVEVLAALQRAYSGTETHETFLRRVLDFAIDAKAMCAVRPTTDLLTAGVLAGGEDTATIYGFDNAESAGAGVTIEMDGTFTANAGELWFLFDPTTGVHELVTNASPESNQIVAVNLVGTYTDASKAFRALWAFPGVYLDPNIDLPAGDDGANEAVKDISVKFVGIQSPTWGSSP